MRFDAPEEAMAFAERALPAVANKARSTLETVREGDTTWFKFMSGERVNMQIAMRGRFAVGSQEEDIIRKVAGALEGQYPTLKQTGALKGLKPKSEGYFYVGLKAIMENEDTFGPAVARLADSAGIAGNVSIGDDRLVVTTNRPVSEVASAFIMAAAYYDSVKDKRNLHRENLRKVGKAYKAYVEANGKAPTRYQDLGLTDDKALFGPEKDGKKVPGHEIYVLMPPIPDENRRRWGTIQAYCKDVRFGRIVLSPDGYSYDMSHARFKRQMSRQPKPGAAPKKAEMK